MTISSCPKCHDQISVPAGADASSRVRCPLCQEEYSLSEVLASLPPLLIVTEGPGSAAAQHPSVEELSEYTLVNDAQEGSRAAPFQFDQTAARPASSASTRSRRRQKSPLVEIVKVGGGGIVGLVVAQLILWWLPGSWQRDPIDIAPTVGQYLPWAVPANFRPNVLQNGSNFEDDSSGFDFGSNPSGARSRFDSGFDQDTPADSSNPDSVNDSSDASMPASDRSEPKTLTDQPEPDDGAVGIRNIPKSTAGELRFALVRVRLSEASVSEINSLPAEEKKQAELNRYEALANLGNVVTHLDREAEGISKQNSILEEMMRKIAADKNILAFIAEHASQWISSSTRSNDGVILCATVKSIEKQGRLYQSRLQLDSSDENVTVYGWDKIPEFYKPGARVILLGVYLQEPAIHLTDYTGDAEEVLCSGYLVPISSQPKPK